MDDRGRTKSRSITGVVMRIAGGGGFNQMLQSQTQATKTIRLVDAPRRRRAPHARGVAFGNKGDRLAPARRLASRTGRFSLLGQSALTASSRGMSAGAFSSIRLVSKAWALQIHSGAATSAGRSPGY